VGTRSLQDLKKPVNILLAFNFISLPVI